MQYSNFLDSILNRHRRQPSTSPNLFGPWWEEDRKEESAEETCYQSSRLRLDADEVGVMPDTGAHDNLSGSVQAVRQAEAALAKGRQPGQTPLDTPRRVAGVGQHSQECTHQVNLPISITDTDGVT